MQRHCPSGSLLDYIHRVTNRTSHIGQSITLYRNLICNSGRCFPLNRESPIDAARTIGAQAQSACNRPTAAASVLVDWRIVLEPRVRPVELGERLKDLLGRRLAWGAAAVRIELGLARHHLDAP